MNDDEFYLTESQEKILKKIQDYSGQLNRVVTRIIESGVYFGCDGPTIDDLIDWIAKEGETLLVYHELKRGEDPLDDIE